jgi:hypothetical protein
MKLTQNDVFQLVLQSGGGWGSACLLSKQGSLGEGGFIGAEAATQAPSSLSLISVSGLQLVANCSLISQSQEALTTQLHSQLQDSHLVFQWRPLKSAFRPTNPEPPTPLDFGDTLGTGETEEQPAEVMLSGSDEGIHTALICSLLSPLSTHSFLLRSKSNKIGMI